MYSMHHVLLKRTHDSAVVRFLSVKKKQTINATIKTFNLHHKKVSQGSMTPKLRNPNGGSLVVGNFFLFNSGEKLQIGCNVS